MLPYPVSANRYWRITPRGLKPSPEATKYKARVGMLWLQSGAAHRIEGKVDVTINLHPRRNKDGSASETRLDLDNAIKVTLDALNGLAWGDDKQVFRINAEIGLPVDGGALAVRVGAL
ncbi:MAG: RusA family crossover junction endodeoxyribonuclease [Mizugakiibacter sp.]|uniref:RusA family crossover junction endodeoxyribonuclease n=1 Tax=Mizugakiibacter sp. TaxID=1972610 RepID=UPI003210BC90